MTTVFCSHLSTSGSRGSVLDELLTSMRRWHIVPFNMLLERAQGLGGNMAHEQRADDIMGHPRANGPPTPGEIVHNAHMHQRAIRRQQPDDFHAATDAAHMGKIDAMLEGV